MRRRADPQLKPDQFPTTYPPSGERELGLPSHAETPGEWYAALAWFLAAGLAGAILWFVLRAAPTAFTALTSPGNLWALPVLSLLAAALAFTSVRSLRPLVRSGKWAHRLGYLASLTLGASLWLAVAQSQPADLRPILSVVALALAAFGLGAFLGGLAATALEYGWYENNLPPSEAVQSDVFAWHRQLIGDPPASSLPKRAFDFSLALFGLAAASPLWLLIAFLVWLEDPGPIVFIKNSVGKGGRNFHQFKFRTMVSEAENHTGPVPAQEEDGRVLRAGRVLRKTALDELPQLLNILLGEMSFVGPRPQRTVLVHGYLQELPGYAERHRVLPGLAGLAQVAGDYHITPLQKLRYDRIYAQHASLGFDLKLLALACVLVFWLRWRKDWDGRLPRAWVRLGSRLF